MILNIPYGTFVSGDIGTADEQNQNWGALVTWSTTIDDANLLNGQITLSDKGRAGSINAALMGAAAIRHAAIDWTSAGSGVLAWRAGSVYRGTNGNKTIYIKKQITLAGDVNVATVNVNWNGADSIDGATVFGDRTKVVIGGCWLDDSISGNKINGTTAELAYITTTAFTETGCTVKYKFRAAPAAGDVYLMMVVSGGV